MRSIKRIKKFGLILVALFACLTLVAGDCDGNSNIDQQRKRAVESRAQAFARAEAIAPVPRTINFPLRKALVKMTQRQDLENHPWYVYILGDPGNMVGYYVAQTVPINACDFLSSTENINWDTNGNIITSAPSLDGIFYGGAGATSGCDAWFFFDYATDALIQIRDLKFFVVDQPLKVDAQPITVSTSGP